MQTEHSQLLLVPYVKAVVNLGSIHRHCVNIFLFSLLSVSGLHVLLHHALQTFLFMCSESEWSLSCVSMSWSNSVSDSRCCNIDSTRTRQDKFIQRETCHGKYMCNALSAYLLCKFTKIIFTYNFRSFRSSLDNNTCSVEYNLQICVMHFSFNQVVFS